MANAASTKKGGTATPSAAHKKEADEIVAAIRTQLEDTLAALKPRKTMSARALSEWTPKLRASVLRNLANKGNWTKDGPTVLDVAADMARIAAILAASDPVVDKARMHGAFRAVKAHTRCPGTGGGAWCDFNI
jgi:hypothetical protein